jgi:hypothetical protein
MAYSLELIYRRRELPEPEQQPGQEPRELGPELVLVLVLVLKRVNMQFF